MAKANVEAPEHNIAEWDFPLWSEILPGLWLGGTDDEDTIDFEANPYSTREITKKDFDTVVTLYAWARPVDWMVTEVRYGVYDSDIEHMDLGQLNEAVDFAHRMWKSGKRVLIRCQAGINRSSLTMGLLLIKEGFTARAAIDLMRDKRSQYVLLNRDFEKFLLEMDKEVNE